VLPIDTTGNSSQKKLKINPLGVRWVPQFCLPQILVFFSLKTPHKISEPYDNSFWEKSNGRREEREEEREKTPLIVNT
jgi:hypothetical protein